MYKRVNERSRKSLGYIKIVSNLTYYFELFSLVSNDNIK